MISLPRLLAGPPITGRPEPWSAHAARLGRLPKSAPDALIDELERAGLLGRGGAGFPVARKWRGLAERATGRRAVVVANGAEGEPGSLKDRTLMVHRPHLVLDGAALAASAIDADEVVLYIGGEHATAIAAMKTALGERGPDLGVATRIVTAPPSYVAGEATAAVHCINNGDARPTTTPPRVSARGVDGRPTLVQNVETLAHVALIARFGAAWYRSVGRGPTVGTALVTISGGGPPVVDEIELGTTVGDLLTRHGREGSDAESIVFGGYFGTWSAAADAWDLPLDPAVLEGRGLSFGCGIVGLLPAGVCGIRATAAIMAYMAGESAAQCGPCLYGLRSISEAADRLARCRPAGDDLRHLERLAVETRGRGACRHPDGAVQLLTSALDVFADEFRVHLAGACSADAATPVGVR